MVSIHPFTLFTLFLNIVDMYKIVVSIGLFLFFSFSLCAQQGNLFRACVSSESERIPVVFPPVEESDVLWVEFERIEMDVGDVSCSLMQVLLNGICSGKRVYSDADLLVPTDLKTIFGGFDIRNDTLLSRCSENLLHVKEVLPLEEVKRLLIVVCRYFNKRTCREERRLVSLCPVRVYSGFWEASEQIKRELFWIAYDEYRDLMVRHYIRTENGGRHTTTLDDFFLGYASKGCM